MKSVIVLRRKLWKLCYGFRHKGLVYTIPVCLLLIWVSWRVSRVISELLRPPKPYDNDLSHFRRSRSLGHYLDNIELLIEPSSPPCTNLEEVPVFVMVTSAPSRWAQREAIRNTWGKHLPTYFLLGLDGKKNDDQLIDNYVEAKQYGDMVVYDFKDHYQNLTLKVGLMLKWTLDRCPQAQYFYKTDDDMVVNPWMLKQVLEERGDAKVLGYVHNNSWLHRDEYNKWFLPRWLCPEDSIPQYATGPGYLINGDLLWDIFKAAHRVPLHNIEDIYYTYNVAKKTLGYDLTHDFRLSCRRPIPSWIPGYENTGCMYWNYASIHSVLPNELLKIWPYIYDIGQKYSKGEQVCSFYNKFAKYFIKEY